jgi:hypothetical protein
VKIPPYNGFGDEEDSLSNVNKLLPKPPKKDYFKWVDNQIQLRFNALMVTDKPEDIGRKFVITFYMNDDTVMVYEPQVRNSGIVSGKFLEKMKYKNKLAGGRFFTPEDFLIGKTVQVNAYKFLIQDQDERTKVWLQENHGTAHAGSANGPSSGNKNPYSMTGNGPVANAGQPGAFSESHEWNKFQNQQPVSDGRGWEQGYDSNLDRPQHNQGPASQDFMKDYYGNGHSTSGQNPGPSRR